MTPAPANPGECVGRAKASCVELSAAPLRADADAGENMLASQPIVVRVPIVVGGRRRGGSGDVEVRECVRDGSVVVQAAGSIAFVVDRGDGAIAE
jgi:16S rRNA C967 or C1407 C5-methylase (RsmB/RsmF family)